MVSFIVVDYNTINKTVEYIAHVNNNIINCDAVHYIIVDNYENDCSYQWLNGKFSEVQTIKYNNLSVKRFQSEKQDFYYVFANANLGYARGNNLGVSICNELFDDDYYIVSNNDLQFLSKLDWKNAEELFNHDTNICVIGPRIIGLDGEPQSPNKRIKAFSTLVYNYIAFKPLKKITDLDYTCESKICYRVSGCFMIIKKDPFLRVAMFDPNTFMYCEEMILSERLNSINGKVLFWNDFALLHYHGATVKNSVRAIQNEKWIYESYLYYFERYRHVSPILKQISLICFKQFILRREFKYIVKNKILKR